MSLRWALFHEGRLRFNSNLRLLTSAKSCPANRAPFNFTSLVLLVISYTGASQSVSQREGAITFGGVALFFLSIGLLGQVAISAYCLYGAVGRKILSWSASPLNTALACLHHGLYDRHPGRGMMGVESKDLPPEPQRPKKRQPSMRKTCPTTYKIVCVTFLFAFLIIVFAGAMYALAVHDMHPWENKTFSFFKEAPTGSDKTIATEGFDVGIHSKDNLLPHFLVFLFGLAMHIIITFTLHCAELLVNIFRDERSWRAAAKPRGTPLGNGAVKSARTSLAWMFLFVLKPVAQWLFGAQGISYRIGDIHETRSSGQILFNPIPLFVLAGVAILLAVFATCLVFRKQSGPQPATYGHLQTIIDAVDDWGKGDSGHLWWGYKGLGGDGVGIVGTSGIQEAVWPVNFQAVYH